MKSLYSKNFRQIIILCITILYTMAFCVSIFAVMTKRNYLPYTESLLKMELQKDQLSIQFNLPATDYEVIQKDMDDGFIIYEVKTWNTYWDSLVKDKEPMVYEIKRDNLLNLVVNYSDYENHWNLYESSDTHGGFSVLRRLVLGYYFIVALILCVFFFILELLFIKLREVRIWVERILLLPVSYILSHLIVRGFASASAEAYRDFILICIITVCLYVASLLVLILFQSKKKIIA